MKGFPFGVRHLVAGAAAVLALVLAGSDAAAAAPLTAAPRVSCSTGYVCFYNQPNYGGTPCKWRGEDDDWEYAPGVCSWSTTRNVRSMYNQGTSGLGVAYYAAADYDGYLGFLEQYQGRTNVNFHVESHFWSE